MRVNDGFKKMNDTFASTEQMNVMERNTTSISKSPDSIVPSKLIGELNVLGRETTKTRAVNEIAPKKPATNNSISDESSVFTERETICYVI
ncbi:MAG: hypothetical protein ACYCPP_05820 [Nitrososphaerales archaeon]